MLGRFSTQAQGWEGPSLGLQQRADLAARLSMASPDLVPLSENMREGYRQIMERGLAVDAELTARLGRSQALKARLARARSRAAGRARPQMRRWVWRLGSKPGPPLRRRPCRKPQRPIR